MILSLFISYAHADEKVLERLHKHLAMMRREGSLESWDDRAISPGKKLDNEIKEALERANVFLALVSPDYLASSYCYEKEFEYAALLEEQGKLRIVPVILEPCDWLSSPLAKHLALPKEGQPISQWSNQNNAFLDVVNGLRRLSSDMSPDVAPERSTSMATGPRRGIKVKRDFDSIDRSDFADKAFAIIRDYFKNSCDELNLVGDGLRAKFEQMNDVSFTCTVVNRAKIRGGEADITIYNQKGRHLGDITYSYQRYAEPNTANGSLSVKSDEYNLFLSDDFGFRQEDKKTSPEQAAENLWKEFVERAGIEYE